MSTVAPQHGHVNVIAPNVGATPQYGQTVVVSILLTSGGADTVATRGLLVLTVPIVTVQFFEVDFEPLDEVFEFLAIDGRFDAVTLDGQFRPVETKPRAVLDSIS